MNKDQAQRIIKDTFENKFDRARFTGFIVELLNLKSLAVSDPGVAFNTNQVPNVYQPSISSFEKIADYRSGEHKLDILIIKLKRETSIERARTMQRNFIAWYLRGDCGGEMKDAALAAFVSPDEEDWRFSLIKMDYSLGEDKKGRIKISEEFTPAKRWSFLVGSNERSHTAQSQLIEILAKDEINPTLAQLEESFNIETVTKEFFKKYKELFFWTKETLDEILVKDSKIRSDFETKNINTVDFSKKLLGQIVFLYFLQKKGWFGVARDADWGTGPKNFLRELFDGKHGKYKNFYNNILELLFYDALRDDRSHNDDYYSNFNCKIPFLNGGLFDPINNYDWVHTDIDLPNELFSNQCKTKGGDTGTGILDIFDRYNFTVKEDEPLEKEVAVDPEMLGKVFENLLEVKDRKSKGTYYTPREIVHYMCQQSLINYLATEMEEKVSKDDIEKLIKYEEQFGENDTVLIDSLKDIPESIIRNAKLIDKKLFDIKVCDPAVGSGAFLVGMMGEIVRTRNVLSNYIKDSGRTIYNFKRDCIENSLYGVDIDPGAVEIAKLRLWLSLVVDEEDIKQIKPLPNLDYKIVCGNSLMSIEKNLFNQELFSELENLKKIFFDEINPNKKKELKEKINEIIDKITNGHKDFDFEIYFSEVFHEKGGFDITIANPPWVFTREGDFDKSFKKYISEKYLKNLKGSQTGHAKQSGKINLFAVFILKSLRILKQVGVLAYIIPNTFLRATVYDGIRKFLLDNYAILNIVDLSSGRFDNVTASTIVLLLQKDRASPNQQVKIIENFGPTTNQISRIILQSSFLVNISFIFNIYNTLEIGELVNKIELQSERLDKYFNVFAGGIATGPHKKKYISDKPLNERYKPLIEGKDIGKYYVKFNCKYILYDREKLYRAREEKIFLSHEKLITQRISGGSSPLKVAYDDKQFYTFNSTNSILPISTNKISIKCLLTLLNSKLFNWYYSIKFTNKSTLTVNISKTFLEQLPIKINLEKKQKLFIEIADKILEITKSKDYLTNSAKQVKVYEYEKQIDQLVYKLYSLTEEEIKIVEGEQM